jgi:hypothetical protein
MDVQQSSDRGGGPCLDVRERAARSKAPRRRRVRPFPDISPLDVSSKARAASSSRPAVQRASPPWGPLSKVRLR